jgi:dipeptidyl aminopeptidase/acylaminoacyl peptidase
MKEASTMPEQYISPFGSWKSPIASDLIVADSRALGQIVVDGQDIYWDEGRAAEGGRHTIMRRTLDGAIVDATPEGFNVRTRVHEYGGGAFLVHERMLYFSSFVDQRLYKQDPDGTPVPLTENTAMRYADGSADPWRRRLVYVREDHSDETREAINTIVSIGMDGANEHILVSGNDFYATPRISPDGRSLAWLTWNHPNMPWDGCELWLATLKNDGDIDMCERIAGGGGESIFQPAWSPTGELYFVSDRTGWWNLYRRREENDEPICPMEAEFGLPQWIFGMSTYGFVSRDLIAGVYIEQGTHHLAVVDVTTGSIRELSAQYTALDSLVTGEGWVVAVAGTATTPSAVTRIDLETGAAEVIRRSCDMVLDPGYLSIAQHIAFPTAGGRTAYGFYYAPANQDFAPPASERPPLLVIIHGGPTAAAEATLDPTIQYWTSRGVAILDVDYGGSTGYGTAYRRRLNGLWGVVDVDDCIFGANSLVDQGMVDGTRLAISGGSAGGFTVLSALTLHDTFSAGASYYGVSDVEALATDTHKFESRYCDTLIGPYPERRDLYSARSPINHVDKLATPLIIFQGLEDRVVPPAQAETMFEAVKAKGIPVAYLPFEGEQHGFRKAENIKRSLDAEFYFYAKVFGYTPADQIDPVEIINLP